MGNEGQGVIELRHSLVKIVNNLVKELGDRHGINWGQVERDGQELVELAKSATHVHIRGRHNHIVEKLKED